jgi:folate-binding Fe-S cluster repair protein YgfZ
MFDSVIYPTLDAGGKREYLIKVDESLADISRLHLKRHKLRSKIQIRAADEWDICAV